MNDSDYEKMSEFSCGVIELDDFFRYEMKECVQRHYLSAYCAFLNQNDIIAVFTLMNDALMIVGESEKNDFIEDLRFEAEENVVDFFNKQTSYPAINIGHLGTISSYQSKGIGTAIIDLVATTFNNFKQAGCQFLTVDALNNNRAIVFYQRAGFSFQTNKDFYSLTRRMYRIL